MRISAAVLFTPVLLFAQAPAFDAAAVDALVEKELHSSGIPGAAIAIVKDGRILHRKGYGVASVETGEQVTTDTLFRIGSTTKMFTAAAVLQLVEEGKLDLHAPISKYCKGIDPAIGVITVHQLLSHTAGLGDRGSGTGSHDDAALSQTIRELPAKLVELSPGEIFSYSSLGYWTAGFVLESIHGKPFSDAVEERVFRPIAMKGSTFRPLLAMTYPHAQQHEGGSGKKPAIIRPFSDQASSWPGGSAFASADGLARFLLAFLNNGQLDGKQALSSKVIALMSTPQAFFPGSKDAAYTYGLVSSMERGVRTLSHGGARIGFGSMLTMAPEYKAGVAVVANRSNAMLAGVAQRVMEMLAPFEPPSAEPAFSQELSADQVAKSVGTYVAGPLRIDVQIADTKGALQVTINGTTNRARVAGPNQFVAEGTVGYFVLVPGTDGRMKYMHTNLRTLRRVE